MRLVLHRDDTDAYPRWNIKDTWTGGRRAYGLGLCRYWRTS